MGLLQQGERMWGCEDVSHLCTKRRGAREGMREGGEIREGMQVAQKKSPSEHLSFLSSLQGGKSYFWHFKAFLFLLWAACWKLCRRREIPIPKAQCRAPACGFVLWDAFPISPQKKTISNTQHCRNSQAGASKLSHLEGRLDISDLSQSNVLPSATYCCLYWAQMLISFFLFKSYPKNMIIQGSAWLNI